MTNDQLIEKIQQLCNQVKSEMKNTRENLQESFDRLKHTDGLEAKRRRLANIGRCLGRDISLTLNSIEGIPEKIDMTNDQLIREIQQLHDLVKSEMESIRENLRESFDGLKHIDGLEAQKRLANIENHLSFDTGLTLNTIKGVLKNKRGFNS